MSYSVTARGAGVGDAGEVPVGGAGDAAPCPTAGIGVKTKTIGSVSTHPNARKARIIFSPQTAVLPRQL